MSNPVRYSKTLAAADANGIAESQTPLAGGALDLDGILVTAGVAQLGSGRRVLFTFAGADAARSFTIVGTNDAGNVIQEVVAGANSPATSTSLLDFKTVTSITIDDASAGAIEVGTSGVGATPWFNMNYQLAPTNISVAVVVTGTVNYTVQYTYDNFWTPVRGGEDTPIPTAWDSIVLSGETANGDTVIEGPVTGVRVLINSGTGAIQATIIQAGIVVS